MNIKNKRNVKNIGDTRSDRCGSGRRNGTRPDRILKMAGTRSNHRRRNGKSVRVPIAFLELADSPAQAVCIAGTFNEWRPEVTRMIHLGDGLWVKELCLPPGDYEYRIVVDGEWIPNPFAREYAPDPSGGINSVLTVWPGEPVRRHGTINKQQRK